MAEILVPDEIYVQQVTARVLAGEEDQQMVYRKRLRRKLEDYQRNVPPHVQAARLCAERGLPVPSRGSWVEYVITTAGGSPTQAECRRGHGGKKICVVVKVHRNHRQRLTTPQRQKSRARLIWRRRV